MSPIPVSAAFQAIADIHTGQCVGYEVLARPAAHLDADSCGALFDSRPDDASLLALEIEIRKAAGIAAGQLPDLPNRLLFTNLHPRLALSCDAVVEANRRYLAPAARQIVTEIPAVPPEIDDLALWLERLRRHRGLLALDRYGESGGGSQLLQQSDIDFLKLSRSLIGGIEHVARQRLILSQLVATAHILGMQVIAVGIESEAELKICRELGCDMAQGRFIQPPMRNPRSAGIQFPVIEILAKDDRRHRLADNKWIGEQLDTAPALPVDTPIKEVFARVASDSKRTLLPVVDHNGHPLGIIREQALRNHVYSAFGKELLSNRSLGFSLRSFLERCPIAPLSTPLDRLLGIYSSDENADGIIITEQNRYRGFLSARSIIRAMHEKTLSRARDENPLTKLPGNNLINDHVAGLLRDGEDGIIAYLDFDNFKPFNDSYGFRQGDRAILLFADLLRVMARNLPCFIGHIGGDDFFAGLSGMSVAESEGLIADVLEKFRSDAESFYDAEARENGYMVGVDRDGSERRFPLLSVSAVLLIIDAGSTEFTPDDVSRALAAGKKRVKAAKSRLVTIRLEDTKSPISDLALG